MRDFFTGLLIFLLFSSLLAACDNTAGCRDLEGEWRDGDGHEFVFQKGGKALWLNRFGQMIDTVHCVFELDCSVKPPAITLHDFNSGPFLGKTLFGIIEFSGDTLFRLCYEIGHDANARPKIFDPEQTIKFFR
ncbi:MAG: hypothetical protein JNJ57_14835 [Saprospiraceae bacterium]|nr:hypothetical protein [Saprospiraceae bacterium]